ncbi:MAG: M48 family metalloprotease [Alphaproteobacteria bacterium]|nr:M48 family metalloprotease [Alphaproteobacteria bacterium]
MSFDFLLELAWKSALISGAALALATLLRRRSAGERSALLATAAALIVALPVITLLLPALPVVTSTVHEAAPVAIDPAILAAAAASAPEPAAGGVFDDPSLLVEWLWAGGAAMVLLRLAVGLWTLGRWTRGGEPIVAPAWRDALARTAAEAGIARPVRLLRADVTAPLSWGFLRPVILIDPDTAREPDEAEAVLAHEVAHVARGDWLVLILSRLAVALFWFNPLMWLLERRIVREAEEAADARALVHVEPARYAQTLLSCAQQYSALRLPASGMADAALGERVRAILERRLAAGAPHPRWIRLAVIAVAALAAPIAALKPVQAIVRAAPPAPPAPVAPAAPASAPEVPAGPLAPVAPVAPAAAPVAPGVPPVPAAPAAPGVLAAAMAAIAPPAPPVPPVPPVPPRRLRDGSPVDGAEIAREVQEAIAEARIEREQALREAGEARREALRDAEEARREALREAGEAQREALRHVDARAIAAQAARAAADARHQVRVSMAAGAEGMLRGADGMERGARQMDAEAEKLRSPAYRAEQIAKAAREGRRVTDEELVRAIPKLHQGADGMRRGAAEMRRSAERMRRQG